MDKTGPNAVTGDRVLLRLKDMLPTKAVHILSILKIIYEELWEELKEKKEIEFPKFGTLKLISVAPSALPGSYSDDPYIRKSRNKIIFILNKDINKYLCNNLDLQKTFDLSKVEIF